MDLHALYGVEFNATVVGGISQYSLNLGTEVVGEARSGEPYPRNMTVVGQKPTASFTSLMVAAALGQCGSLGSSIADLAAGLMFYCYKYADGGARASGSAHRKLTMTEGLIYPTTLTAAHGSLAEIAYNVMPKYDGSNDPVAITDSSAVPTASTDAERFALGGVTVGGKTVDQITNLSIDFGVEAEAYGVQGAVWPTIAVIKSIKPVITITTNDIADWAAAAIPTAGLACTQANTIMYLRKYAAGGIGFLSDVTAEHIKLQAAGVATIDQAVNAQGSDPNETTIRIDVKYDGSNAPILVNAASAIT